MTQSNRFVEEDLHIVQLLSEANTELTKKLSSLQSDYNALALQHETLRSRVAEFMGGARETVTKAKEPVVIQPTLFESVESKTKITRRPHAKPKARHLTDKQLLIVRDMIARGWSNTQIANRLTSGEMKVTEPMISSIRLGKTYRQLAHPETSQN